MKKIVILGALGHIGSSVIRKIPDIFPGIEITMIDNMMTQRYCSLFNLPLGSAYRFIETDILSTDLRPIIEGTDVVLQLAAITDAAGSFKIKEQLENNNFNATAKVAIACEQVGSPMIHMSSTSVYGTQKEIIDEHCTEEELKPQSPYAETKLREEKFLQEMGNSGRLRFVICRFGTICGISPGMRFHTAVNKFCWQAIMGQPLTIWTTALHQKRPYLVLQDGIAAYAHIMRNNLFNNNIYNILTGNFTVDQIVKMIRKHIPDVKTEYVDTEIMNQLSYEVSCDRFKNTGFVFTESMETSIENTITLLRNSNARN